MFGTAAGRLAGTSSTNFFALLLMCAVASRAADDTAAALTEVTDLCTELVFDEQLLEHFSENIRQANKQKDALVEETMALNLATAKAAGTPSEKAFLALTAASSIKLQKQKEAIAAASTDIEQAIEGLTKRIAQLAALQATSPDQAPTKKAVAASAPNVVFGGTTKACKLTTNTATGDFSACKTRRQNKGKLAHASKTLTAVHELKLVPDDNFVFPAMDITAKAHGNADSAVQAHQNGFYCAAVGDTTKTTAATAFAVEDIVLKPPKEKIQTVTLTTDGPANKVCKPVLPQDSASGPITADRLAALICNARSKTISKILTLTEETAETIRSLPAIRTVALILENPEIARTTTDTNKREEAANKAVNLIFGSPNTDIKAVYLSQLSKGETKLQLGNEKPQGTIQALATAQALPAALAFFHAAAQRNKDSTQQQALEADSEDKDCSSKKGAECIGKCEWDKEKEICKANKKGEGENKEKEDKKKDKCTGHTEKTKCEAENTGKSSPVCGWRKGKDNEPDQDKEMCRNGSILANKQFALSVVSAAFVALLF
uniref:Variant surface glycoprotein n=1 Tax=Trypanosoma brucei TaxID=5691 RepID=A0A1V0FXR5_9TRYP|nr:variant surface glycoprotein [Trypanosoma brucei]